MNPKKSKVKKVKFAFTHPSLINSRSPPSSRNRTNINHISDAIPFPLHSFSIVMPQMHEIQQVRTKGPKPASAMAPPPTQQLTPPPPMKPVRQMNISAAEIVQAYANAPIVSTMPRPSSNVPVQSSNMPRQASSVLPQPAGMVHGASSTSTSSNILRQASKVPPQSACASAPQALMIKSTEHKERQPDTFLDLYVPPPYSDRHLPNPQSILTPFLTDSTAQPSLSLSPPPTTIPSPSPCYATTQSSSATSVRVSPKTSAPASTSTPTP
jgi:hypothetical protein